MQLYKPVTILSSETTARGRDRVELRLRSRSALHRLVLYQVGGRIGHPLP